MYIGIRDVCLFQASYETLAQGMDDLELDCVEVAVDRNMRIPAPAGALGRPRLSIADQLAAVEVSQAYARQGLRISGLLLLTTSTLRTEQRRSSGLARPWRWPMLLVPTLSASTRL